MTLGKKRSQASSIHRGEFAVGKYILATIVSLRKFFNSFFLPEFGVH